MNKNQIALTNNMRREQMMRIGLVALVIALFIAFAISPSVMTTFAAKNTNTTNTNAAVDETALNSVVSAVINIISTAAKYIGVVIVLWGVFNIIMALRREDSEAIGKQITTVAVGGVLAGFGVFIKPICNALGVTIN